VFLGDSGAPPRRSSPGENQFTTLPATPESRSEPFLYTDASGAYNVFVPAVQHDSVGPSYAGGSEAGRSIPIRRFLIADPGTPVRVIDAALAAGHNLILTPGVYRADRGQPSRHGRDRTRLRHADPAGRQRRHGDGRDSGYQAVRTDLRRGAAQSRALLVVGGRRVGWWWAPGEAASAHPTLVQDVFFRVGGAEPGRTQNALVVNTDNTILDDVWSWRADHGDGVGRTTNRADTGLIVNGDDVKAYGLFVEHHQKFEVIWNGRNGEDVFLQNEMPYDPPSQAAWRSGPATDGYAAFLLTRRAKGFRGYGMGSYSFFN
jgi:hypothetical protein